MMTAILESITTTDHPWTPACRSDTNDLNDLPLTINLYTINMGECNNDKS